MATPIIATSTSAFPIQAATLAFSYGELYLTNFSESFSIIESENNADTNAFADGGIVTVENQAIIEIEIDSSKAFIFAISSALGQSKDYFGLVETDGRIILNFDVSARKTFSFNFTSAIDMETSIEDPSVESASAIGEISFFLYDTTGIPKETLSDFLTNLLSNTSNSIEKSSLDFFSLFKNINTLGDNDLITSEKSQNVTISSEYSKSSTEGKQEFATASIKGSFKRYFDNPANVTLVAFRTTQSRITAPEPSDTLALLSVVGLVGVASKGKSKATNSDPFSEKKVIKVTAGNKL